MSTAHLQEYDDYEKSEKLPSLAGEAQEEANALKLREFRTWNSQNHWERKAALLPPPLIEHLDSWAEAAVAYQRAITAKKFYASTIGRQLKSASNESGTQNSLLYSRICRGCNNPVDDAQCDTCKAYKKAILERIRTAQFLELNLREALEKRVETEFDVGQERQKMKNGLKVILGRP